MAKLNQQITHDGGSHLVEIELGRGQAVITFGSSFTLRVDEANLDKLRGILYEATRELMCQTERDDACPTCGVAREPGDPVHGGFRCDCWQL